MHLKLNKGFVSIVIALTMFPMSVYAQDFKLENAYKLEQRDSYIRELNEMASSSDSSLGLVDKGINSNELLAFSTYRYWLGGQFGRTAWYSGSKYGNNFNVVMREPNKAKVSCKEHLKAEEKLVELISDCTTDLAGIKHLFSKLALNYGYSVEGDSPYDLLYGGNGSCHAFSKTFARCLDSMGIECYYVLGYTSVGGFHAWNAFVIDDKIYTVDLSEAALNKDTLGEDAIWNYFREDSSMTLGDGRTIDSIY